MEHQDQPKRNPVEICLSELRLLCSVWIASDGLLLSRPAARDLRRSSGALRSCNAGNLGLKPEAIMTRLLRSQSQGDDETMWHAT